MTSLNGWQRLWLVAALVIGIPSGLSAYNQPPITIFVPHNPDIVDPPFLETPSERSTRLLERAHKAGCQSGIQWERYSSLDYKVTCPNPSNHRNGLLWLLLPGLLIGGIGLLIRWIYKGFKPTAE